jgi:hypothetical protein
MRKDNDIFMHVNLIDKVVWEQSTLNTDTIIITSSRDDTYNIMSLTGYKNVSHFTDYKMNKDHFAILKKSKVENIILMPLPNYQELAIELINCGYSLTVLNQTTKELINSTTDEINKTIKTNATPYYEYIYTEFAKCNDILTFPSKLESFLTTLIDKIDFNSTNHIQFNRFLIYMIGLDNGCGEPLLFNFIKNAIIDTYNSKE